MKNSKKKVFVMAMVLCLLAIISVGSLAWFSDSDSVENKFYIASSDDDTADEVFSVELFERVDLDGDGRKDAALFENGMEYNDILPGDKLIKEPVVRNTGYYDQYIRVTVTISDAQAWLDAIEIPAGSTPEAVAQQIFGGLDLSKWAHVWNNLNGATAVPEDLVYVMYYKEALAAGEDIVVFETFNVPNSLTQAQAAAFEGGFTIDIKADAVQTENVVPDGTAAEDAAWAAFKTVESNA